MGEWRRAAVALALVSVTVPASAQPTQRFALETTVAVDQFNGDNAVDRPNVVFDIIGSARLGSGWQIIVRPWIAQRREPEWTTELYQALVRYERQGRVAIRLDSGFIGSPVGLGLIDSSPSSNPLIASHSSYFSPMTPFDTGGPRISAISSTYPLGSQVTFSTDRWDVRGALVSTTPTRVYALGDDSNPRHTPVIEAGAGITPHIGLRIGVSFAQGAYLTSREIISGPPGDRMLTMIGVEGEYSFGYTKLAGEIVRDRFETPDGTLPAYEWFLQGSQTLSPRWFVSARHEGALSPVRTRSVALRAQPRLKIVEATLGFRLTSEVFVRGSYLTRQGYGRTVWDQQAGAQIVWSRRWW